MRAKNDPKNSQADLLTCSEIKFLKQKVMDLSKAHSINWLDIAQIIKASFFGFFEVPCFGSLRTKTYSQQAITGESSADTLIKGELGSLPPYRYIAPTKVLVINGQTVLCK